MPKRVRMTESLDIDADSLMWCCNRCGTELISASENYKKGCLVYARNPQEVHNPVIQGEYTWSPDPKWINIVEFYCPNCQVMFENEYLPLGHPITHDIELDIEAFKVKYGKKEGTK